MGGLDAALGANAVATSADARFASGTRWGSLIADIMIALGVGGEVLFGAIDSRLADDNYSFRQF
jgi:hypothetical protein